MKRRVTHRFSACIWLATRCLAVLCLTAAGAAASSPGDSVHPCVLLDEEDWRREGGPAAGKRSSELNAGEPGTVRMFYFLPNDRPYRQSLVDTMKARMVRLQAWFGQQMASHGYGYMTFRYEAEATGVPVVHRLDGDQADAYYLKETGGPVQRELFRRFDVKNVVNFIVVDTSTGLLHGTGGRRYAGLASGGKYGGSALVGGAFIFSTAAHELTHAFGLLWHDFRDNDYILSFGADADRLSACSARYLAVTPLLNPEIPLGTDYTSDPTIEFAGPTVWYAPGTERFTVSWRVADPDGVHQVIQWTGNPEDRSLTPEVKACRDVAAETEAVVSFEYDGVIPSLSHSSFSYPTSHNLPATTVDTKGNRPNDGRLIIAQASPHHVATLTVETKFIYDIAIFPGGDLLAMGTRDSTRLWLGGQSGRARLWDLTRREEVATMVGDAQFVNSVAFSHDGVLLASSGVTDKTVKLWDVARREAVAVLDGHKRTIESVAFSPEGLLASGGRDGTVRVWDVARREAVAVLDGHTDEIRTLAFSPDGGLLASGGRDRTVRVWDVSARQEVAVLDRHTEVIASIAFSPDGGLLASAGSFDRTVRLWDTAAWHQVAVLTRTHSALATHLAFSPDGGKLATVMDRGTIYLWDVRREEVLESYNHPGSISSIAFTPDGRTLAVALSRARIELWDTSPHTTRTSWIPDWDGDGEVGFGDFVTFAAKYGYSRGEAGYDPRFDLDGNGEVGFSDFLIFAAAFGQGA